MRWLARWRGAACGAAVLLVACQLPGPGAAGPDPVELERGRAVRAWDAQAPDPGLDAAVMGGLAAGDDAQAGPVDRADEDAGSPGGPDAAGAVSARAPSRVLFRVTTLEQGGRYQPKNIGAIWIEDARGNWLKTLALWASVRERYLLEYAASNPTRNKVDAVTSATLRAHTTHEVTWDLRDASGAEVPDGEYTLFVEVTDRDAPGQLTSLKLTKSVVPSLVTPADTSYFSGVELRFE